MTAAMSTGFVLGISLILAIGAQNAFVLRQGLRGEHVLPVVLSCALSDAVLIACGVAGFSALADVMPRIAPFMRYAGAAFLIFYGALALRAAWRGGQRLTPQDGAGITAAKAVGICLALTWLNPHVYLDTVLLIGSVSTRFEAAAVWFALGAIAASFVFFFALGFGAALLRPVFARPVAWRVLDLVIGLTMWGLAAGLLRSV